MRPQARNRRLATAVLAVLLLLATLGVASPANAAQGASPSPLAQTSQVERQVIVEFGDPVIVQRGERVQTVVSIGGDVTIAGTVDQTVVAVGGDVMLRATAKVGGQTAGDTASVVVINGELTRATGAEVTGDVEIVDVGNVGDVWEWASERGGWQAFSPFASFVGWLVSTVVFLLLGLLAAAVMPGQIRAVGRQVAKRPGGSLGWGALAVIVIVPVSMIVLAVTIIGLLVVIPAVLVLPFFTFFVVTAVGTFVVERLFGDRLKGNLMAAVAIAVVATSIVVRVPALGALVLLAMIFMGAGAAVLAWNAWRLERKALRNGGSTAVGPYGGPAGEPGGAPGGAPQGPAYPPHGYAQPPIAPPPVVPSQVTQPQVTQPPYGQPAYAQPPFAQPPYAQAPVGTQAYLHPQYGWIVYPPQAQTQVQPPEAWAAPGQPVQAAPTAETADVAAPVEPGTTGETMVVDEGPESVAVEGAAAADGGDEAREAAAADDEASASSRDE